MEEAVSWFNAEKSCAARGTQLAKPDSQAKNENIKAKLRDFQSKLNRDTQFWFGARRDATNQWRFTDGSSVGFTDWAPGKSLCFIN